MRPPQAQTQPETSNALHHPATPGPREEVPGQAVLEHSREGGVFEFAETDRDPGEDLVPEPKGQGEETSGGRVGEVEVVGAAVAAAEFRVVSWGRAAAGVAVLGGDGPQAAPFRVSGGAHPHP